MANDEVEHGLRRIFRLITPSELGRREKFAEALVQKSAVDIYCALFEIFQDMLGNSAFVSLLQRYTHYNSVIEFRFFVLQCGKRLDKGAKIGNLRTFDIQYILSILDPEDNFGKLFRHLHTVMRD